MEKLCIKEYQLREKSKTRIVAGEFDLTTREPKYTLEITPKHIKDRIISKQALVKLYGSENICNWIWDVENKSDYLVLLKVYKEE